jgi:NADH:ubiquinone reductase (H+-translocating)
MEVAGLVVPVFAIIVTGWLGYIPRSLGDGFVMSCQCARSTGQFAGHNAVADLFSLPMLPLQIDSYVTVLDPGG